MSQMYTRRQMLRLTGSAVAAGVVGRQVAFGAEAGTTRSADGLVAGEPTAAEVGNAILKQGGNAVDAIVAAALAAAVTGHSRCGIGGYGGHMVICLGNGKKITAIDFNTTAPAAAREN